MNILVVGAGGREHTFCWKLAQSPLCDQLFAAPGNAGTATVATNLPVSVTDFQGIKAAVLKHDIKMVVVGPEDPLVMGIHDFFKADSALQQVAVIGPEKEAAQLEGSKEYAKAFMMRHQIPTAKYQAFTAETVAQGEAFLETMEAPYVLKADGLAAGKGVLILQDLQEAKRELRKMLLEQKFGAASSKVVIEEFLDGIELSCFVLSDGKGSITLPMAKDYKRIGEGDTGLNTGGMGAVSPVPFVDAEFQKKIDETIVQPTVAGLKKDGLRFKGFIFIGLIKVGDIPKVIEYNVRMGDPETEVVLPRIKTDFVEILNAIATERLDRIQLEVDHRSATTVVAVSGGYPESYKKGFAISGLETTEEATLFHAGTIHKDGMVTTSGGRVLAVTAMGDNHQEALERSYQKLNKIHFEGINYRKDIGFDL